MYSLVYKNMNEKNEWMLKLINMTHSWILFDLFLISTQTHSLMETGYVYHMHTSCADFTLCSQSGSMTVKVRFNTADKGFVCEHLFKSSYLQL